jgi:hypothetical protein
MAKANERADLMAVSPMMDSVVILIGGAGLVKRLRRPNAAGKPAG